ncbi:6-phosphogluconolactonase [Halopseudomonas sp.]|uniref:6-phosphogluconolactonase n=1 Tax=Halopseudomonas sp. TaxID=2901191 RepID=UPI0035687F50
MNLKTLAAARGLALTTLTSPEELAVNLAEQVAEALRGAIRERGIARLAVSGGRSPEPFLRCLDQLPLDWERVAITLVDERWVPVSHPDSNAGMLRRCLPSALERTALLPLFRGDSPAGDARAAELDLASWLPLDVVVLGMGADGHCASLFAGQENLRDLLRGDSQVLCAPVRAADGSPRVTLTAATLRSARLQLLAISGDDKYRTLCEAFSADSEMMPVAAFLAPPLHIFYSGDFDG